MGDDQLYISSNARERVLVSASLSGSECSRLAFWEKERSPSAAARWLAEPNLLLVTLALERETGDYVDDATVAFFDVTLGRYLWPSLEVGRGFIDRLEAHPSGVVFGVSRQEGRVLRFGAPP